jgi:UDP-N-acetylenolpyruvoylglucosamine reductase
MSRIDRLVYVCVVIGFFVNYVVMSSLTAICLVAAFVPHNGLALWMRFPAFIGAVLAMNAGGVNGVAEDRVTREIKEVFSCHAT